jgi:CRP-like cAMP-binding protein
VTSVNEAFEQVPFVRALAEADRRRLAPYARIRALGPEDDCWTHGQAADDFVFVVRGRLKLVRIAESGRETILEMGATGDLLCGNTVLCYAPRCCSALPMNEPAEVLLLPRRDVLELIERNAAASRALMRELADRGRAMCGRVEELGAGQVEQRIALLILKLADRSGVARPGQGIQIPVRLSRRDLADLCGTTVETAIRVMSRFKKQQILESNARGFILHDRAALGQVATGDSARRLGAHRLRCVP